MIRPTIPDDAKLKKSENTKVMTDKGQVATFWCLYSKFSARFTNGGTCFTS